MLANPRRHLLDALAERPLLPPAEYPFCFRMIRKSRLYLVTRVQMDYLWIDPHSLRNDSRELVYGVGLVRPNIEDFVSRSRAAYRLSDYRRNVVDVRERALLRAIPEHSQRLPLD